MAFSSIQLVPGVNAERTPTLLRAGVSQSALIRYRDGIVQKYGGWTKYFSFSVSGIPRDLHAWEDLNQINHLAVGTTTQLGVITNGSLKTITPQTKTTNFAPGISTVFNSPIVTIIDPNVTNVTSSDAVFFQVPVSIGGLILDGLYQITTVTGPHSYTITAPSNATANSSGSNVPIFTTVNGSSIVTVAFPGHGLSVGSTAVFSIPTTGNGVTISGAYAVTNVPDANNFTVTVNSTATSSGSFTMNGGQVRLLYYINLAPPPTGAGYGLGGYGLGGYGTGVVTGSQTGTPITATSWTNDNWGQLLLSCPRGGGIYYWDPTGGYQNAALIATAPPFNNGIFISMSQQIVVAFGSSVHQGIGYQQEPMLVQWCDASNFFQWEPSVSNQAGNFVIPIGSEIRGGMAVSNQNLIWTDLDLWAMNYVGFPNVFGFTKVGAGAGLVSTHAAQQLRGSVYWMGQGNFYVYTGNGVSVIPCPVWDVVFQNLNTNFLSNICAMPNTPYNEVGWLFPSTASTNGENDSYVKMNISEPGSPWDYGIGTLLQRSACIDQTILGMPVTASSSGIIYQQETTPDADGSPLLSSFTTGYFYLAEGQNFVTVDQVLPDFRYGTFGGAQGAQIQLSFNMINNTGDTPAVYGPYTVGQGTNIVTTRMRGRQMSITVASADIGSFWRIGLLRYRWSSTGRR